MDKLSGLDISDYNKKVRLAIGIHELIDGEINKITEDIIKMSLNDVKGEEHESSNKCSQINKLLLNLSILETLHKKYKSAENKTDIFRDYVISLLLEQYSGSKRDRDGLIKELRKFTTTSEIYKHLVEVLWENAIMELLIRADIQEKVRTPKSVGKYYELLWKETEKMLNYIATDPKKSKVIYKNLCKEAGKKFICNDFLNQEQ